jgi:hypothetical protein
MIGSGIKGEKRKRKSLVGERVFSWDGYLNEKIETLNGH